MKILVVEDNEITRKMVRIALRGESYDVLEAADARTAIELAERECPDLVLQDLRLPDMDGVELLRRLRALPSCADVPILAFSGFLSRLEEARATAVGFTDFVVKPVQPSDLLRAIQAHLPPPPLAVGAGRGRRILLADDDPVQRKLGRLRLELQGFQVRTAADGLEAFELARTNAFDAIVSDVLMPRLDGFGLCLAVRQERHLARVPVVLCSNTYLDPEDEALARRMGASAFVLRTADMATVIEAAQAAIAGGPPPALDAPGEVRDTHVYRVIKQLERQAVINAGLSQRCASQSAALAILSTISDMLAKSLDSGPAVDEMLGTCLEAGGFSVGVLYLLDDAGRLTAHAHSGYHGTSLAEIEALFGHEALFREALETGAPLAIPSAAVDERTAQEFLARTGPSSALILPVLFREEPLGVLLVATDLKDLTGEESLDFARTVGHQIGQVIALRRAFARVAAAEQQYREIFEQASEGIFRSTREGRYLVVNPAMARIFGFASPQEMVASAIDIGRQFYVDPAQREELTRLLERHGTVSRFEGQGRRKDGTIIWASQSVHAVRDERGEVRFYEGLIEDVTERKKAEATTAALAATARGLLESLDGVAVNRLVTDNVCRLLNAHSATVYRLEPGSGDLVTLGETARHQFWTARLPAGTGLAALAVRDRGPHASPDVLLSAQVRLTAEARAALEATRERATLAVPLLVGDGVFGALVIRDQSGRVFEPAEINLAQAFADQAAIALSNARLFDEVRAGRDFLASVTQNSADGIVATDGEGRVTFFSSRAEEIWGRRADGVLGRSLDELLGGPGHTQALLARLRDEPRIQNHEATVRGTEGRPVELSLSFAPVRNAAGAATGLVAVARDTTERKRTEAALRQSEKLAAMSSLVAGVAHEVNNPLSVILAHSTLLAQGARGDPQERAGKIVTAAERCARLVRNFLALARQHPPERQRVSLTQIVKDTAELVAYPLRLDGVTIAFDLADDLPPLWADLHQLQQIFLNLFTNAHHALRSQPGPRVITVSARRQSPDRVRVDVADSGPGIPAAIRERIFEPFFTTKPTGEGTGLGLSLCQRLVESHGGTISADNLPHGGAVFTLVLPVTPPAAPAAAAPAPPRPATGLAVLIVDDEADVAEVLADMLGADHHRVDIAVNGLAALEQLRTMQYDLVLSDLRMPGMDGPTLYRRLEAAGHPIVRRFIFITGDVLGPNTRQFLDDSRVPAIAKPFALHEIRSVIRQVLAVEASR